MSLLRALSPGPLPLLSTPRRGANPNTTHPKAPSWGSPSPSLTSRRYPRRALRPLLPVAAAAGSENPSHTDGGHDAAKPRRGRPRRHKQEAGAPGEAVDAAPDAAFPSTIPRKPRRGRRSEAAAVEDFVRGSLERAFAEIRKQNPEVLEGKEGFLKGRAGDEVGEGWRDDGEGEKGEAVVEEEDPEWPADAEVGWGVRASEYFDKHPIRNVVVDGVEIDWEGELDEGWVKEINCLEWESFAFHPSPLIVLVFERYNRAADNWKLLKELEKAAKVYWSAKDRLPPRTVKIDMNIETDLAYALKVKECPQLLFLRGNRILYREKDMRTADELVQMIAHFYYNAKRPSWVDAAAVAPSH